MSPITSGPPPVPYRSRNRETQAQLENARVALSLSRKTLFFLAVCALGFVLTLLLLDVLR